MRLEPKVPLGDIRRQREVALAGQRARRSKRRVRTLELLRRIRSAVPAALQAIGDQAVAGGRGPSVRMSRRRWNPAIRTTQPGQGPGDPQTKFGVQVDSPRSSSPAEWSRLGAAEGRRGDPTGSEVSFTTQDAESDHTVLRARGVEADAAVMRMGDLVPPMFTFRDPDGNRFRMVERD